MNLTKEHPLAECIEDLSVVHVVRQYAPMIGGLEDFVRQLVSRQRGRFRNLRVVTLDRLFTEPDRKLPMHEEIEGVDVHRIPYHGSKRYPLAPGVFSQVADADLVHVHAVDYFFDALALSNVFRRKKLVATTHGGFFHTDAFMALKKVWLNGPTRLSASFYDAIACCSANDFEMFNKIAPSKVTLIENGVDCDKFRNASSQDPVKRIVTIGRFSKNKRLDMLLKALHDLVARDADWHLDIIGSPSDLSVEDLRALVARLDLEHHVDFHIRVSEEEMRQVMSACSLFASASEYEGFGIAMVEALSAGLIPVVAPNTAFKSLAVKHPAVRLTSFENPQEAALAITRAGEDLALDPDMRMAAMTSAEQNSWDAAVRHYDDFYRKAVTA
ncbi:glycosyltransferase family 4 protein [Roseibium sp. MMSF_3544]|uniref:glycosyltransferase family 4 protein n=1 Tax=unclassified Roseibium TaxID=2629323 RepID=UPI00273DC513|nr:glycosyltransferase family 4 protein [Roseibium sp. MMSF_3544]